MKSIIQFEIKHFMLLVLFLGIGTNFSLKAQNCPSELKKLGAGKLQAAFDKEDKPNSVQVQGTNDERFVSEGGIWLSNEKYDSPKQTLLLKIEGVPNAKECSYDESGKPVEKPADCEAQFTNVSATGMVITWSLLNESMIREYNVINSSGEVVHTQPNIDNETYDYTTPAPDTYTIVAVCLSGGTTTSDQVTTTE